MIGLTFKILGEEQYARRFNALGRELTDLREPLADIARRLVDTVGEQFDSQGSHGGTPWEQLTASYEAWKDEHYPGRPTLVRSGDMRRAYLLEGTRELDDQHLVWGVTDQTDSTGRVIADRALAHQTGQGHMPERKIVALRHDDRRAFDHIFTAWINAKRHQIMGVR